MRFRMRCNAPAAHFTPSPPPQKNFSTEYFNAKNRSHQVPQPKQRTKNVDILLFFALFFTLPLSHISKAKRQKGKKAKRQNLKFEILSLSAELLSLIGGIKTGYFWDIFLG
jgi:hypothetical protein